MDFMYHESSTFIAAHEQSSSIIAPMMQMSGYDYVEQNTQVFFDADYQVDGLTPEEVEPSNSTEYFEVFLRDICAALGASGSGADAVWKQGDARCHLNSILVPPSKGKLVMFDEGVKYIPESLGRDCFTLIVGNNISGRLAVVKISVEMVDLVATNYNLTNGASIFVAFADLPGQAVGEAAGSTITLDSNAAGHGWYFKIK